MICPGVQSQGAVVGVHGACTFAIFPFEGLLDGEAPLEHPAVQLRASSASEHVMGRYVVVQSLV
jgi:hypothetical protein